MMATLRVLMSTPNRWRADLASRELPSRLPVAVAPVETLAWHTGRLAMRLTLPDRSWAAILTLIDLGAVLRQDEHVTELPTGQRTARAAV